MSFRSKRSYKKIQILQNSRKEHHCISICTFPEINIDYKTLSIKNIIHGCLKINIVNINPFNCFLSVLVEIFYQITNHFISAKNSTFLI